MRLTTLPRHIKRLAIKMTLAAAATVSVAVIVCATALCTYAEDTTKTEVHRILAQVANEPFAADGKEQVDAEGKAPFSIVGAPQALRIKSTSNGSVLDISVSAGCGLTQNQAHELSSKLIARERNADTDWFLLDGTWWLGMWLPAENENGKTWEAIDDIHVADKENPDRIYSFIDVSAQHKDLVATLHGAITAALLVALAFITLSVAGIALAIRPVAAAWEQQRAFAVDASHRLKTPLMAIMAACDVAEQEQATYGTEPNEWIPAVREAADTMAADVTELLNGLSE